MLATLIVVAWLSATPIPEPESLQNNIETPQATETVGDFTVTSAIIPGGPGVNTYDTVLSRATAPATDVAVHLQLVNPKRGIRSHWHPAEQVAKGLFVAAGDDIDEAGEWWSLIDIIDGTGELTRAAFAWEISESAAIQQSRHPSFVHLALLLIILLILAVLVYAKARRLLGVLNLRSASGLLAIGVVAVSLGIMGFGAAMISEQQQNYELTLNPPPEHVNTVLPDADSLRRGAALYRENCLVWQGQSADFRALSNRLDDARDDFVYAVVAEGWRDLPPCKGDLSVEQRWDIVNYFRTFEVRDVD